MLHGFSGSMKYLEISVAVLLLLTSSICSRVSAYPEAYGPFEPGQEPAAFPLQECHTLDSTTTSSNSTTRIYAVNQSAAVRLQLCTTTNQAHFVTIIDALGKPLCGQHQLTDISELMVAQVYTSDLNKDGKPDFVAWLWQGGCGLAAENNLLILALSSDTGYKIITRDAMAPNVDDFIDVRRDKSCQFISTSFVYGDKGKDGKTHNYWAYELYEINKTEVQKANQLLSGFPKLVWYSFRDNHKETDQLTSEQKNKLVK